MSERWLPVVGFEGSYEVSDQGRVRSLTRRRHIRASRYRPVHWRTYKGQFLRPGRYDSSGHVSVVLGHGLPGKPVHLMVLEAFVTPLPPGKETRHLNGVADDNRLSNICYGTRSENMKDAWEHGAR